MKLIEFGLISWAIVALAVTIIIFFLANNKRGFLAGLAIFVGVFYAASWILGRLW